MTQLSDRPAQANRRFAPLIRVLIADDHEMVRQAFRTALETLCGFQVVAEAADGIFAVEFAAKLYPDVVVMDIHMPRLNGIEATRRIVAANPLVKIVGCSTYPASVARQPMLDAGAIAYVSKSDNIRETCRVIERVVGAI